MEIYACSELGVQEMRFRPSTKCYKYIPVQLEIQRKIFEVFLDPELRILSATSPIADCGRFRKTYFELEPDRWIIIDTRTGITEPVKRENIHVFKDNTSILDLDMGPLIFREWIAKNDSTEVPFRHINELTQFEQWKENEKTEEHSRALTLGAIPGGLPGLAKQWLLERLKMLLDWWIIASCAYATFLFLRDVVLPLALVQFLLPIWGSFRAMMGRGTPSARNPKNEMDVLLERIREIERQAPRERTSSVASRASATPSRASSVPPSTKSPSITPPRRGPQPVNGALFRKKDQSVKIFIPPNVEERGRSSSIGTNRSRSVGASRAASVETDRSFTVSPVLTRASTSRGEAVTGRRSSARK